MPDVIILYLSNVVPPDGQFSFQEVSCADLLHSLIMRSRRAKSRMQALVYMTELLRSTSDSDTAQMIVRAHVASVLQHGPRYVQYTQPIIHRKWFSSILTLDLRRSYQCGRTIQFHSVLALTHWLMVLTGPLGRSHQCNRAIHFPPALTLTHWEMALTELLGRSHQCNSLSYPIFVCIISLSHWGMALTEPLGRSHQCDRNV